MAATKKPMSNNNYYIVTGLITALAVVATVLVGQSMVKSVLHNNRVNTALNKANKQLTENITASKELVAAYAALGPTQQLVNDALPAKSDFPGLTALLENAGAATGVTIKSVSPVLQSQTTVAGSGGSQQLNFSTTVTGTYPAVLSFLSAIQTSARPIQVTSATISGTGSNMTVQITGIAYYQGATELPFSTETVK